MATSKKLLSLLGKQTRSATFQAVLAADKLKASKEPDLKEGTPAETYFVGKKAGYSNPSLQISMLTLMPLDAAP